MQALRAGHQSSLSLDDDLVEISDIRKCSGRVPLPFQPLHRLQHGHWLLLQNHGTTSFPTNRKRTDCVLAEIVCETTAVILQIGLRCFPSVKDITHHFIHAGIPD